MISLPSGPHIEHFRWQFDLFWYCHKRIYGPDAHRRVKASIVKRDDPSAPRIETLQWPTDMPHTLCEAFFDLGLGEPGRLQLALNIQGCLLQQLHGIPDDTIVELIHADMCHIRPAPGFEMKDNELIVDDACENWYLESKGAHRHVIEPHLKNGGHYNGGFVPVIGKAKTLKAILPRWIAIHKEILTRPYGEDIHWWAGAYALQAACDNARVQMIGKDLCYVPGFNTLQDHHYIAHYSVDRQVFDKRRYPNVDRSSFPDNVFYNMVGDWMDTQPAAQIQAPAQTQESAPPQDCTQRLAEGLLLGRSKASIQAGIVGSGLAPGELDARIAGIEADPIFKAATRVQQLQHKLESLMNNMQKVQTWSPRYARVDKRTSPSRDEFIERYVLGNRPVVLTDVARDWPAMQRWSPEDLKQRFGHLMVEIQDGRNANHRYEIEKPQHKRMVRLDAYVDRVLTDGPSNDYYITGANHLLSKPGFEPLLAEIGSLPELCDPAGLHGQALLWFGPAGTLTPLHHDGSMLFHTQIVGRKRWRLVSPLDTPKLYNYETWFSPIDIDAPDYERFPLFKDVTVLDVMLEPGDTLYLPLGWWHHVTSLSVSVSVTYMNVAAPNHLPFRNPQLADCL